MKKDKAATALVDINHPIYGVWQGLYLSFYSRRFYVDVLKRWTGPGWTYLLLMLMILCVPLSISLGLKLKHHIQHEIFDVVKQIPTITVINGQASLKAPVPYQIKNSQGVVTCYIDTSRDASSAEMVKRPKLIFYIARNGLMFRTPIFQLLHSQIMKQDVLAVKYYSFSTIKYEVINGKALLPSNLNNYLYLIPVALYLLMLGMFFPIFAIFFLAVGGLAKFVSRFILKTPLGYAQSCRVLVVSVTPAMTVLFYFLLMDLVFPGVGALLMVIFSIYFSCGVLAYRNEAMQLSRI
jgi:hypothetical protein